MERIRAFIALNLPLPVVNRMVALQRELREAAGLAKVRVAWVPPPNLHVTLKFLGEIPADAAYAVRDQLGQRLTGRSSWPLEVGQVGVFPDEQQPRVLWLGLHDEGQMAALAADVEAWMDDLGFAREKRTFHPHVTLGRIKEGVVPFWQPSVYESSGPDAGPCSPTEVVLYRSVLQRQGAEYHALSRTALR